MARPKNQLSTVQLRISITRQLREDLEMLVHAGRHGASVNDAINRLVSDGVRAALREGQEILEGRNAYSQLITIQQEDSRHK